MSHEPEYQEYEDQAPKRNSSVLWTVGAAVLAVIIIAGGVLGYRLMGDEDLGASDKEQAAPATSSATQSAKPTTEARKKPAPSSSASAAPKRQGQGSSASKRYNAPAPTTQQYVAPQTQQQYVPPKTQQPAPEPEPQSGYSNYDHNGHTSEDFAANVYEEWQNQGGAEGGFDVYSPTTGQTYHMTCNEGDTAVRCTGGDNAVVSIY